MQHPHTNAIWMDFGLQKLPLKLLQSRLGPAPPGQRFGLHRSALTPTRACHRPLFVSLRLSGFVLCCEAVRVPERLTHHVSMGSQALPAFSTRSRGNQDVPAGYYAVAHAAIGCTMKVLGGCLKSTSHTYVFDLPQNKLDATA